MDFKLFFVQTLAVFLKKFYTAKRDKRFLVIGLIFPLVATIGVIIAKYQIAKASNPTNFVPISLDSTSSVIPYLASPGVDPTVLFPYFPKGFRFQQFNSVDTLNSILLNNDTNYQNIIGGYDFINIDAPSNTYSVSVWYNDSVPNVLPGLTKTLVEAIYAKQNGVPLNLKETAVGLASFVNTDTALNILAPTLLQYGIMFMLPYFAVQLVIEKEKKLKEILMLNSLNRLPYWIGSAIGDQILFWFPNLISLILLWIFQVPIFVGSNAGPAIFTVLMTGWAGVPFVYLISFLFGKEETANRWIYSTISILSAIPTTVSVIVKPTNFGLNFLALIPPFGYFRSLSNIANGISIATPALILFLDGVVFWALILALDYNLFAMLKRRPSTPQFVRDPKKEDDDVHAEQHSLSGPAQPDESVRVKDVVKSYDGKFVAVKGVSFRVRQGECFGLLGPNGAGKTSILGVMYGAQEGDSGDVNVKLSGRSKVQGVCAQFDYLWDLMTGREHLQIYAKIKGLEGKAITEAVDEALELFGLKEFADQTTVGYSGGTKRKLSSAIALLADPVVVFMDEPSTGMDPVTRRLLWNVIEQKKTGRAMILTTHSMEEAEALCTRVGIMVMGQLRCLGSPQHLRNKYGSGYRLTINTDPSNMENIQSYVNSRYQAKSQMAVGGVLNFDIQKEDVALHKIFQEMERVKAELSITDYCLSQTSLEQVFLRFATEQEEEMRAEEEKNSVPPVFVR